LFFSSLRYSAVSLLRLTLKPKFQVGKSVFYVPSHGSQSVFLSNANVASAIIDSTQNVAVAVLTTHASPFSSAAYAGVNKPATEVTLPLVHRHNYGWNSLLSIQNTRPTTNYVTLSFRSSLVGTDCTKSYSVASLGTLIVDTTSAGLNCLGTPFVGSARITAWYPVAAAYTHYSPNFSSMIAAEGVSNPSGALFAPLIQNNNYGSNSAFTLQNAAAVPAHLAVTYYQPNGSAVCPHTYANVSAYRAVVQNPAPSPGCAASPVLSARQTGSAGPAASEVLQFVTATPLISGYPAVAQPTNSSAIPRVFGNWNGWVTGIQVQNAGGTATTATVNYYSANGLFHSQQTATIQPNAAETFFVSGSSFVGSAMIRANQPIAVAVNHLGSGSGDILMSHIGINH
jgi:hypothetical protein